MMVVWEDSGCSRQPWLEKWGWVELELVIGFGETGCGHATCDMEDIMEIIPTQMLETRIYHKRLGD